MLEIAAALIVFIGIVHSWLGERFILMRLFCRGDLPYLFGSDYFTRRTLRFVWHITTIAWFGFAWLLLAISWGTESLLPIALYMVAGVFLLSGVFSFAFTRGKHLSWLVFWSITGICFFVASTV